MRHTYLREYKRAYCTTLLLNGKLVAHRNKKEDPTNVQMAQLIKQMVVGVSKTLKAQDQMTWIKRMNNIRNEADKMGFVK